MDANFKDEYLNDFKCEGCESVQEVVIRRQLTRLPRILILYLKRYQCVEVAPDYPLNSTSELTDAEIVAELSGQPPQQQPTTAAKTYRLVKNDSDVDITCELSLKSYLMRDSHTNEVKVERPKPVGTSELSKVRSKSCEQTKTAKTRKRPFAEIHTEVNKKSPLSDDLASGKKHLRSQSALDDDSHEELVDLTLNDKKVRCPHPFPQP